MTKVMEAICLPKGEWGDREFSPVNDGNYRLDYSKFLIEAISGPD